MAEEEPWGTLEELLLACAVNRHGMNSWDSISMEVRSRSSNVEAYSPQNCRRKFHDLRRRFAEGEDSGEVDAMVDELKRLRVAELRREVEQRDVSIAALRLKLKKLEEEREESFKEGSDPIRSSPEKHVSSPENLAGVGGESISSQDSRSFHEANSTNRKSEEPGSIDPVDTDPVDPVQTGHRVWSVNPCANGEDGATLPGCTAPCAPVQLEVLEKIRSHKLASVFHRPLRGQEYGSMIRRPMDLERIQSKAEEGAYAERMHAFFRDLLLLFNNGVVFFPPNSPERLAAVELRALVSKQMVLHRLRVPDPIRPDSRTGKHVGTDPAPMVVFRKRSSANKSLALKHGRSESEGTSSDEQSDPDSVMENGKLLKETSNACEKAKRRARNGVVRSKERGVRGRRRVGRPRKRRVLARSRSPD